MKSRKRGSVLAVLLFIGICSIFLKKTGKKDVLPLSESDSGQILSAEEEKKVSEGDFPEEKLPEEDSMEEDSTEKDSRKENPAEEISTAKETVVVHVCGAVLQEGVYELPEGARVADALLAAGGVSEDAAGEYLNQAEKLTDGIRIYVPSRKEIEEKSFQPDLGEELLPQQEVQSGNGKVDLNRAGREELMSLPGIGESKADAILAFREAQGNFQKIEDLMKVPGIKEGVFQKIKDFITIDGK